MIRSEVATLLERFATKVERLPGVSRTNPHEFAEAKSELKGEILAEAKRLREVPRRPSDADTIQVGLRVIDGRPVRVERRRATR